MKHTSVVIDWRWCLVPGDLVSVDAISDSTCVVMIVGPAMRSPADTYCVYACVCSSGDTVSECHSYDITRILSDFRGRCGY